MFPTAFEEPANLVNIRRRELLHPSHSHERLGCPFLKYSEDTTTGRFERTNIALHILIVSNLILIAEISCAKISINCSDLFCCDVNSPLYKHFLTCCEEKNPSSETWTYVTPNTKNSILAQRIP
ncbi:hypothetical protein MPTK2_1g20480 [Marchantia polymorpha subsp. ruderalis]